MRMVKAVLDLGNVWHDEDATTGIILQNTSPWAPAHWNLQALPMPQASRSPGTLPESDLLDLQCEEADTGDDSPGQEAWGQSREAAASDKLDWLRLAARSGTLAPGASTTVQVKLLKSPLPAMTGLLQTHQAH